MIVDLCLASFTLSKIWCLSVWFKSQKLHNWVLFIFFSEDCFGTKSSQAGTKTFSRIQAFIGHKAPGCFVWNCVFIKWKPCTSWLWTWSLLDPHFHSKWEYYILISTQPDLKLSWLYTGGRSKKRNFANKQQGSVCDCWPRDSSISIPLDMADGAEAWGQAGRTQRGWAEISDFLKKL